MTEPDRMQNVLFLRIRCTARRTRSDFSPFTDFPEALFLLAGKIREKTASDPDCLDLICSFAGITLVFKGEETGDFAKVLAFIPAIRDMVGECNELFRKKNFNFCMTTSLVLDAGKSRHLILPASPCCTGLSTWTGLFADRLDKLTRSMDESILSLLITHAFYTNLSPEKQDTFPTAYYIQHICCYGEK